MTSRLPAGVVFDCDGTLVDTEPVSRRAWTTVLRRRGYEPTVEDFAAIIGHVWPRTFERFRNRVRIGDVDAFREEIRSEWERLWEEGIELFEDAVATLVAVTDAGVPVAVCSSSGRAHIERVLALGGLRDRVTVVVGREDTTTHKPQPGPYTFAVRELGLPPSRCTALEDTAVGVAAARAAGLFTVGVLRSGTAPQLLAEAHRVVSRIGPEVVVPGW